MAISTTAARIRRAVVAAVLLAGCGDPYEFPKRAEPARPIERAPAVEPRAPEGDAIEYTLRFDDRARHHVDVEAVFPTGGADEVELSMAVWTPGSYLIREYARHVVSLDAATLSGDAVAVRKTSKNRWAVATGGGDRVVVRYRVYGRARSVRDDFIDADLAVLNGAPTFLTLADGVRRPHDVTIVMPESWAHSVTGMPAHASGDAHRYLAADYDELVDSPIALGNPALYEFEVEGVPHVLATFAGGDVWDNDKAGADVEKIVRETAALWGVIPYQRYVFINVLMGGGGLEHESSTLIMGDRWATRRRADYRRWLALASHEFFHTWNVKRLRPVALGPFDYERELYTKSLWVAEGITDYYDNLLLARAGLMKSDEYLEVLSAQIADQQETPGRELQSLADSSFDTWIKYYRRDEGSDNSQISYYTKGAIVGFLLDAEIRRVTDGKRSLDDVLRLAYERYSGERGYTPEQFRAVASEVAGASLDEFLARAVDGTDELQYEPALAYFGLAFGRDDGDKEKDEEEPGWLGAEIGSSGRVWKVLRGTPAYDAGLNVDDELLAIDDYRVTDLDERLKHYRPGDAVELVIARDGQLRRLPVTLGEAPKDQWKLSVAPRSTPTQRRRRQAWLGQ